MSFILNITADTSAILSALKSLEGSPEMRQRLLDLVESGVQLVRIHADPASTTRTGELRVLLEPTDALLELVPAMRAGARSD